ncbi:MAG: acyl carrier protein [Acidimicrobiia bacterium]|nr:acyl carrier protein [Acidimicrobiia bacterium]NNF11487.1 acyl carrier protein [Acidimicrobiia bacterium]NNL70316.1 acyl carrier protein [Acidimicrobiia bacterium]
MEAALITFVNEEILAGHGEVTGDDEIVLDGTLDSLGVARLIGFIEAEFAVTVPAQDVTIEHFRTINTMADYVRRRVDAESVA